MCAIVGLVDFRAPPGPDGVVQAASLLHKRGPDDAGHWHAGPVALAHRRLSIIDLSAAGRQPMTSCDGRYVIVFNGEIYNFRQLRAELADQVTGWRSDSDTEVILAAFAR